MIENYLKILEESLQKKVTILENLQTINERQTAILSEETVSLEKFDVCVDEKDVYITELTKLDDGFESLYEHIKQELVSNKEAYYEQIGRLQQLIALITDKSVSLQAQESRNKAMVEKYFAKERSNLTMNRKTSTAAYNYYKNVNKSNMNTPQFLDKKN